MNEATPTAYLQKVVNDFKRNPLNFNQVHGPIFARQGRTFIRFDQIIQSNHPTAEGMILEYFFRGQHMLTAPAMHTRFVHDQDKLVLGGFEGVLEFQEL